MGLCQSAGEATNLGIARKFDPKMLMVDSEQRGAGDGGEGNAPELHEIEDQLQAAVTPYPCPPNRYIRTCMHACIHTYMHA